MSGEYRGKYLTRENAAPKESSEGVDKELEQLLGDHYQDMTEVPAEPPVEVHFESKPKQHKRKAKSVGWNIQAICGLIAGVGLLFYIVVNGEISTEYGLLFTAGVSAACGYRMK